MLHHDPEEYHFDNASIVEFYLKRAECVEIECLPRDLAYRVVAERNPALFQKFLRSVQTPNGKLEEMSIESKPLSMLQSLINGSLR